MIKKSLGLLFIFLSLSCKNEPTLTYQLENFNAKELKICEDEPCSNVVVDYPIAKGDKVLSQKINAQIEQWIASVLFLGEDDVPPAKTVENAVRDFVMAYRDYQADLPTTIDTGEYEAEIEISKGFDSSSFVSFVMNHYTYTGGAHGYAGTSYLNLNTNTGKAMATEDLFSNSDKIRTIIEAQFRKQYEIPEGENINSTGFWFENDTFSLPETIGLSEEHLLITYNPYEIAPYSEGIMELKVPLEQVDEYFNF